MRRIVLALTAALAVAVSACAGPVGGQSSLTTSGTGAAGSSSGESSTAATDPAARIKVAHYLGTDTWDPHANLGGPSLPILALVYDSLVHLSPSGEALPGMATSWEFSDDGQTLTMQLRPGITFSDGSSFDSSVVKANIERGQTLEKSTVKQLLSPVESVETPDPETAVFRLNKPYTALPILLADRPGIMVSANALTSADLDSTPVGSGPFTLTAFEPAKSGTFDRNPDYWDADSIKVAGLDMTVIADSKTRLNALLTGAVDSTSLDVSQIQDVTGAGMTALTGDDLRFYGLQMNPQVQPALDDPNVRLALSLALDREGIVEGLLFGNGTPVEQIFPPNSPAYNQSIAGEWKRDLPRAKQLLADAGYPDGFDLQLAISTDAFTGQLAEAIQSQWADVGVNLEIRKFDGYGSGNAYWNEKSIASALFRLTGSPAPGASFEKYYTPGVQANPGSVSSPEVEAQISRILSEPDQAKQATLAQQISAELVEKPLSVVPVVKELYVIGNSAKVTGMQVWAVGYPNFTGVGITQ